MTLVILLTSCTTVPRTLETEHDSKIKMGFEPPWWSSEKFYASVVLRTVRRSCSRPHTLFSRASPVFTADDRLGGDPARSVPTTSLEAGKTPRANLEGKDPPVL